MPGVLIHIVALDEETAQPLDDVLARLPPGSEGPVMIMGLELSNPSSQEHHPVLAALNLSRPEWPRKLPRPVVLWIPEYLLGLLGREAPDFLDWRSATLHFPDLASYDSPRPKAEAAAIQRLTAAQRRARIEELQARLVDQVDPRDWVALAARSEWYNEIGSHLSFLGDLSGAEQMYRNSLELAQRILEKTRDERTLATAYGNLGGLYARRGDLGEAERMLLHARDLFEKAGDRKGVAESCNNLGAVYGQEGDLDGARESFAAALQIREQLGDLQGVALGYANLGLIAMSRGDLQEAEQHLLQALAIDEKIGSRAGLALDYRGLGTVYERRGDLDRAERLFLESAAISEDLGNCEGQAEALANLGVIHAQRGDQAQARQVWTQALALYSAMGLNAHRDRIQKWLDELERASAVRGDPSSRRG